MVCTQIRTEILSVLIWAQTVCKGFQQAKVGANKERDKKQNSVISDLNTEVRDLKKEKASLEDQLREIRMDTERKLKRQAESNREAQVAEEKLQQVMTWDQKCQFVNVPLSISLNQTWGQLLRKSNYLLTITLVIGQLNYNYNYMAFEQSN